MLVGNDPVFGRGMMAVALVGLMIVAGCSTTGSLAGVDLPRGLQIVGGGFRINWEAPAPGTVYLVEKTSGKVVETESLDEGDVYEFEMDLDEEVAQTFATAFGIRLADARLVLYFKPASSTRGAS